MEKIHIKEKGITIITLVITIIILLILAGISIAALIGNDGLINKTKKAKSDYENAQEEELAMLDEYGNLIDSQEIKNEGNINGDGSGSSSESQNEEYKLLKQEVEDLKGKLKSVEDKLNYKPTEYIRPTAINGVEITGGGYCQIGNVVYVSIEFVVDETKLPLTNNLNQGTIIFTDLPKAIKNNYVLAQYALNAYNVEPSWVCITQEGQIKLTKDEKITNTSNSWGITTSYIAE